MKSYVITCCSTADMSAAYLQEKNIPYVCFHFEMDGKEYPDDLGKTMPFDEFYQHISAGSMPTTSQVNIAEFMQFFEPFLQEGKDILHMTLSSGLSGTFNSACAARDELLATYPERSIYIVDSLAASSGYGLLVDTLHEMQEAGTPLEEATAWLEEHKLNLQHWFFTTDLSHLKRGGRISPAAATFGNILNICPLMNINNKGELIPRVKVRGKKKVIAEIVNKMKEHAENGPAYSGKCFISNSACYEDAKQVADLIEKEFPNLNGKVQINSIGTVIGSHTGPGTVALFYWGDERTN